MHATQLGSGALREDLSLAAKMEAMGREAAAIAHDLNNILSGILAHCDLAHMELSEDSPGRQHVDQALRAAARGKRLVQGILAFGPGNHRTRAPVRIREVVEEALELLEPSVGAHVRIDRILEVADAAVIGDATQLYQVVMNLCTNAVQAIERQGVVTVMLTSEQVEKSLALSHGTLANGNYVRLVVSDTGIGITPAAFERLFEPFFTTKEAGKGTGLGLSLVQAIVADLGGAIDVVTRPGNGSTFTVWLPAVSQAPAPETETSCEQPRGKGQVVMVVDDDSLLMAAAQEMLAALGYQPAGFPSGAAALKVLRAEPERFDVVLIDEVMPQLSGIALAAEIRQRLPEIPILLMSGYSGRDLTRRAQLAGADAVLRKPFLSHDIAEAISRVLPRGR